MVSEEQQGDGVIQWRRGYRSREAPDCEFSHIGATTTKTGLKIECALDKPTYEKGIKVSDAEMEALDVTSDDIAQIVRLLCDVS